MISSRQAGRRRRRNDFGADFFVSKGNFRRRYAIAVINSISTQKTEKHRSSVLYSSFFVGLIAEINRTCPSSEQQLQEGSASAKIVSRWFFLLSILCVRQETKRNISGWTSESPSRRMQLWIFHLDLFSWRLSLRLKAEFPMADGRFR